MKANNLKWFFVGAISVTASLSVLAAVNIPNTFTAGQPIKASDVNANFSSLKSAVDALQSNPVTAPLNLDKPGANAMTLTGGGTGVGGSAAIANSALIVSNTNASAGIGAYIVSQGGDASLIVAKGSVAGGQLIKGFSNNNPVFLVDYNGTVTANGVLLTSDRNAKKNFSSVNTQSILEKVVHMPISSWNYKTDANSLRHIGPMAQDFHATFGLNGTDDKHISSVDEQGVALAAIQGLNQKLELENAALKAQFKSLEARLAKLERK
jgi:Chaperone of endosialidase